MTYNEAVAYIHSLLRFGSKPGLARTERLLAALGDPQKKLRFIHVAGTNGKGSVCTMLAGIMRAAGYKTGLYISPYVLEFRERIQINGEMIPKDTLAEYAARLACIRPDSGGDPATEFEFITALAMRYFADEGCDIVILETGLGGRLDSTNVIDTPVCSVITSISPDHTEYLGGTLGEIAAEKCGIIKPNGITVCYPKQNPQALEVIKDFARRQKNRLDIPDLAGLDIKDERLEGSGIVYNGMKLHIPLAGRHQILNALTAYHAAKAAANAGFAVPDEQIAGGISRVRFPARFELISNDPPVILDGGHNADGSKMLAQALSGLLPGRPIVAIMGVLGDKDYKKAAELIAPLCKAVITVTPGVKRGLSAELLAAAVKPYCGDVTAADSVDMALELAADKLSENAPLLVCGSLYLAGEIRDRLIAGVRTR